MQSPGDCRREESYVSTLSPSRRIVVGLLISLALLAGLRIAQYLSIVTFVYDDELTEMAQLALDLRAGDFHFDGLRFFLQEYTFQPFSQGTILLQLLTAFFSLFTDRVGWALQGSVLLLEGAAFTCFLLLGAKLGDLRGLMLAALLWLVATPASVVAVQLMPYGIHTEFLFVPLAGISFAVLRAPSTWGIKTWIFASIWMALGIVIFRSNLFPALAFTATVVFLHRDRTALFALGGLLLAGGLAAASLQWVSVGGWSSMPQHASPSNWTPLDAISRLPALFSEVVPGPRLSQALSLPWRLMLLLGAPIALIVGIRSRSPSSLVLVFAALWALIGLAAVVLLGELQMRYTCPPFYALLVCWLTLATQAAPHSAARKFIGLIVVCLTLGGIADGVRIHHPSIWKQTLSFESVRVGQELQVRYVELDELPYWQKILDENRGSEWIGGLGDLLGRCSNLPLTDTRVTGIRDPRTLNCQFEESESTAIILRDLEEWNGSEMSIPERLIDMGRGGWIRNGRDLNAMESALGDIPEHQRNLLMTGARDEARRWGQLP